MWWASSNQLKALRAKDRFLKEQAILSQTTTQKSCLSFSPAVLPCRFLTQDCNTDSYLNLQPASSALQISDLLASTVA